MSRDMVQHGVDDHVLLCETSLSLEQPRAPPDDCPRRLLLPRPQAAPPPKRRCRFTPGCGFNVSFTSAKVESIQRGQIAGEKPIAQVIQGCMGL